MFPPPLILFHCNLKLSNGKLQSDVHYCVDDHIKFAGYGSLQLPLKSASTDHLNYFPSTLFVCCGEKLLVKGNLIAVVTVITTVSNTAVSCMHAM